MAPKIGKLWRRLVFLKCETGNPLEILFYCGFMCSRCGLRPGVLYFWQHSGWCLCCWPQPSWGAESCSQHTMNPCPHPSLLFIILPLGNLVYPQAAPNYVWARFSARPWEYVCEALANPYFYLLDISLAQGSASEDSLEPATWLCPLVLCPSHPQRCYEPNAYWCSIRGDGTVSILPNK